MAMSSRSTNRIALAVGMLAATAVIAVLPAAEGPPPGGGPGAGPPGRGADPDWVAPAGCPAADPAPTSYVVASQVESVALLPPPPARSSAQQQADLEQVLAAQRAARAAGATSRAVDDSEMTCARFKDVLGQRLKSPEAAAALKFISQAAMNGAVAVGQPKRYWKRPRPYVASAQVERLADAVPDAEMARSEYPVDPKCVRPERPPRDAAEAAKRKADKEKAQKEKDYTSYPSGHATFGVLCAILLADVVPEKRDELFARGRQYGESRLIVGAHYPSDVAAGQTAGAMAAALLMQNPQFERRYFEARTELRTALGYPAKAPDLEPDKDFFKEPNSTDGGARGAGRR